MYLHLSKIISSYLSFSLLPEEDPLEQISLQIHIVDSNIKQSMPALPKYFAKSFYLHLIICESLSHWTLAQIIYYSLFCSVCLLPFKGQNKQTKNHFPGD